MVKRDSAEISNPSAVAFSYREVVSRVRESVVTVVIKSWREHGGEAGTDMGWGSETEFEGRPRRQAGGGGIVLTSGGLILTNHHLVTGARKIILRRHKSMEEVEAVIVGSDAATDVALLRAAGEGWRPATLADSSKVQAGDVVLAVGSPFGLEHSVTMGIISATGRADLEGVGGVLQDFIQTDAAIHPGNSGGALVDGLGRVVGITSARYGSENIGLAVPVDLALKVASDLLTQGRVQRGFLGVRLSGLTRQIIEKMVVPPGIQGVVLTDVEAGGPADRAGLVPGDIVTGVDGLLVTSMESLRLRMTSLQAGSKARLSIFRAGGVQEHEVLLEQPPDAGAVPEPIQWEMVPGLKVALVDEKLKNRFLLPRSLSALRVMNDYPQGPAEHRKLHEGDLIIQVNNQEVQASARAGGPDPMAHLKPRTPVLMLKVIRAGTEVFVGVPNNPP